ncbi:MAG: 4-hydroxy-tetrahydrodipicolinate reductase [Clostridia bacterium]|nr:4-hydroxy-tetrahydrodipicolinate reductase [Clostridia bacterium]
MIKVLIHGYLGTMGQWVKEMIDPEEMYVIPFDVLSQSETVLKNYNNIPDFDVIIDFSHYSLIDNLIEFALERNKPVVICTTNLSQETQEKIEIASEHLPIFQSGNMSLGINVMLTLASHAAAILKDFDIEIIEKHHNQKIDAPSGTAKMIVDAVNLGKDMPIVYGRSGDTGKRQREIGVHAVRGGTIVGEHHLIFAGEDEVLEIKHQAASKKVFAQGAIAAGKFLMRKNPGFYNMSDLVKEYLNVL